MRTANRVSSLGAMPVIRSVWVGTNRPRCFFYLQDKGASSPDYPQCRQAFAHCLWGNAR